jgi:hypothetical protein
MLGIFGREHSQPGISPANASITNAVSGEPAAAQRHVGEVGHVQLARPGGLDLAAHQVRSPRRRRIGNGGTDPPPRVAPRQPQARLSRSTVHLATGMPCRLRYAHIFTVPYSDSGGRRPFSPGS